VALKPSKVSGTFDISLNGKVVFSRKEAGRFPEAKEVGHRSLKGLMGWGVGDGII
jgi:selT/selW/selH-like putative selenoprotein